MSGDIEFMIPVTESLLDRIKPDHDAFSRFADRAMKVEEVKRMRASGLFGITERESAAVEGTLIRDLYGMSALYHALHPQAEINSAWEYVNFRHDLRVYRLSLGLSPESAVTTFGLDDAVFYGMLVASLLISALVLASLP